MPGFKRKGGNSNNRRSFKKGKKNGGRRPSRKNVGPTVRNNPRFLEYYTKQPNLLGEHEVQAFISTLQRPLPSTFRINPVNILSGEVKRRLKTEFAYDLGDIIVDGHVVAPPRPLSWYPNEDAWQLGCSVKKLRRTTLLKPLHSFVVQETDAGNISRQEAVSMLPPIMLGVEAHHLVLDMCAAPGSKTGQLLEAQRASSMSTGVPPTGFIIANDADAQRAYMLTHQVKRIGSAGMMITTHMGQYFPNLTNWDDGKALHKASSSSSSSSSSSLTSSSSSSSSSGARYPSGTFDRVLCDVPCSGDGTLRKNGEIWSSWSLSSGIQLHPLQVQIAMRGIALLKVGGLLVYSTCSFNPMENEAVVASLLRRCGGSLELVDTSHMLPKLRRRSGLKTWKVAVEIKTKKTKTEEVVASTETTATTANKDGATNKTNNNNGTETTLQWVDSFAELPEGSQRGMREDMFPPSNVEDLPLERCWRMMPHDQNTGGFFLALLRKTSELQGPNGPKPDHMKDNGKSTKSTNKNNNEEGNATATKLVAADPMDIDLKEDEDDTKATIIPTELNDESEIAASLPKGMLTNVAGNTEGDAVKGRAKSYQLPVLRAGGHDLYNKFVIGETNVNAWNAISEYYGIKKEFPHMQLYTRSQNAKVVSYVNTSIAELTMNFETNGRKLKIVNAGLRMFEKSREKVTERKDGEIGKKACPYRLNHEGLHLIEPYITKRKVEVTLEDIEKGMFSFSTFFFFFEGKRQGNTRCRSRFLYFHFFPMFFSHKTGSWF